METTEKVNGQWTVLSALHSRGHEEENFISNDLIYDQHKNSIEWRRLVAASSSWWKTEKMV